MRDTMNINLDKHIEICMIRKIYVTSIWNSSKKQRIIPLIRSAQRIFYLEYYATGQKQAKTGFVSPKIGQSSFERVRDRKCEKPKQKNKLKIKPKIAFICRLP